MAAALKGLNAPPVPQGLSPRVQALLYTLAAGGIGAGLGAGAAGVAHLVNQDKGLPKDQVETEINLPYPQLQETKAPAAPMRLKRAFSIGDLSALSGAGATSAGKVPWLYPAAAVAGLGGAYLGSNAVKGHFREKRKAALEEQLAAAQKEYQAAMLGQYDKDRLHKIGAAKEPTAKAAAKLDQLCDMVEKKAFDIGSGAEAGGYLTLAALLAGATGLGTKSYLDARSKEKLIQDAVKHRAMLRHMQNPPDVYVRPVPTKLQAAGAKTVEDPLIQA